MGLRRQQDVSGEIIDSAEGLRLMLRLNDHPLPDSPYPPPSGQPFDESQADALFTRGARELLEVTDPFFVAASDHPNDLQKAREIANRIIATLPARQRDAKTIIARSYNLLGVINEADRDDDSPDQTWSDRAQAEYKRALEVDPSFFVARLNIADVHVTLAQNDPNKLEDAKIELQGLLKRFPYEASVRLDLADVYFMLQENDDAEKECRRAIELLQSEISNAPMSAVVHREIASALAVMSEIHYREAKTKAKEEEKEKKLEIAAREFAESVAAHRRSIRLDPSDWLGHYRFVLTLARAAGYVEKDERARFGIGTGAFDDEAKEELCDLFAIRFDHLFYRRHGYQEAAKKLQHVIGDLPQPENSASGPGIKKSCPDAKVKAVVGAR